MGEVELGVDEFYESRWREANTPLPDCLQISRDLTEKELECHDVRKSFWLKVMFGDGKYVSVSYHPRESKSIRAALFSQEGYLEELVNSDARIPRRGEVKTVTVCNQTDRPIFLEYDLQRYLEPVSRLIFSSIMDGMFGRVDPDRTSQSICYSANHFLFLVHNWIYRTISGDDVCLVKIKDKTKPGGMLFPETGDMEHTIRFLYEK